MATIYRPRFATFATVLAPYGLIKAEKISATVDLSLYSGGTFFIGIGFGGSTDLTNGVDVRLNKFDTSNPPHPANYCAMRTGIDPGICLINNGSNYAIGAVSIAYDGGAGRTFVAGDYLCFWSVTTIPTASGAITPATGIEFLRSGKGAATPFLLDRGLKYAQNDNTFIGLAECWTVEVGPGKYEVIFDYLDDAAGEAVCCYAGVQAYDVEQVTV